MTDGAKITTDSITLYNGDAFSILRSLPSASVDAVITDPPYSSGGLAMSARQADPRHKYQDSSTRKEYPPMLGDGKDQRSFTAWVTLWLTEAARIAKPGAPLLIFTDWRQLPAMTDALQCAGWLWLGIIPWIKRSSRPQIGKFRQQCEYILFGSRGRFSPTTRQCFPGVYDYPIIPQQKVHITSKPVALLKDLMAIMPEGGTVLDPFIGGGTTAIAAMETGRKCIGIEISPDYFAITAARIQKAA